MKEVRLSNCIIDGKTVSVWVDAAYFITPNADIIYRLDKDPVGTVRWCMTTLVFPDGTFIAEGLTDYTQPVPG